MIHNIVAVRVCTASQLNSTMPRRTIFTQEERAVTDAPTRDGLTPKVFSKRIKQTLNVVKIVITEKKRNKSQ